MSKALTASGALEYVEKGQGAPLVLLHGGTGSIDEWGPCVDRFAAKYHVIAYNRRGYGESTPREVFPANFLEEDVEDLAAFLDLLGLTQPVFFCAFSDGGTIALMFAARFPGRVRAMVCAGAHIYVENKAIRGLVHAEGVFEHRIAKMGLKETPRIRSQRAWFQRWLHADAGLLSMEDRLSAITCPTLIIQGAEDEYAETSHAERIAEGIEGSELWIVEGARHWIHGGEHADAFIEKVMVFLADK
jgi:pimeloyl-ACP methyl ester carboxylesterase